MGSGFRRQNPRGIRLQPDFFQANLCHGSLFAPCAFVRPRHPVHLKAFDYIGPHRYSLTFCTDSRRPHFVSADAVGLVWSHILRTANDQSFAIVAYCFMPDHLHLLVEGQSAAADLRQFITLAKQSSGFYFSREFHVRLWQRYGFERVLRREETTAIVARYILENPVRAGLVRRVDEYPFVGSSVYSLREVMDYIQLQ